MTSHVTIFALGFTSLGMLGWMAAAAVPLLIHLWNRRKYREVSWAAMEYLLAALQKNSRRIRVEQLILLAVRTLIVLLAVLAVAGPYLEQVGGTFVAGERAHKVLVIDGSYSMAYRPTDKSRFDRAKELAAQIVDQSSQGDGFTLVLMSDEPRVVVGQPAFDPGDFTDEIQNLKLPHGGANLAKTLGSVEQILAQAGREHPRLVRKEIFFLTDLGRVTWQPELTGAEAAGEFRERLERLAKSASMVVIDLGQPDSTNLAVTGLQIKDSYATVAGDVTVEAVVRNFGRLPQSQRLQFLVDGERTREMQVQIPPGGETPVAFSHRFATAGDHEIEARLAGDLLSVDNSRWVSLRVKEQINVLCVDGNPGGGAFRGEAAYLALALNPERERPDRAVVRTEIVTEGRLSELDLAHYDCIFLANVGQFTADEGQLLAAYLRQGGGLVFFLGDRVSADRYNHVLGPGGETPILPVLLEQPSVDSGYRFDPLDYRHPIVAAFKNNERAGLLMTQVYKYWRLKLPEGSTAAVPLAFAETHDPAIVEASIQAGRTLVVAVPASISPAGGHPWTIMPKLPAFLPLTQELLASAVRRNMDQRNTMVGDALGSSLPLAAHGSSLIVSTPDGRQESVRTAADGDHSHWSYDDTGLSGVYRAEFPSSDLPDQMFAVNVNTAESDLTKLDSADLSRQFTALTNWQNLDESPTTEITPRNGLHQPLLYGVLILLLIESFLAWLFGRLAS